MYPPIFYFITPFLNFSGVQREREKKTTPFLKKSPGEKSNTPLFYNSRAGLCRTKSTPLPEILGTRMRSLRPRSGGPGSGQVKSWQTSWSKKKKMSNVLEVIIGCLSFVSQAGCNMQYPFFFRANRLLSPHPQPGRSSG